MHLCSHAGKLDELCHGSLFEDPPPPSHTIRGNVRASDLLGLQDGSPGVLTIPRLGLYYCQERTLIQGLGIQERARWVALCDSHTTTRQRDVHERERAIANYANKPVFRPPRVEHQMIAPSSGSGSLSEPPLATGCSLLFSFLFLCSFCLCVALKLRSLGLHPTRLCGFMIYYEYKPTRGGFSLSHPKLPLLVADISIDLISQTEGQQFGFRMRSNELTARRTGGALQI